MSSVDPIEQEHANIGEIGIGEFPIGGEADTLDPLEPTRIEERTLSFSTVTDDRNIEVDIVRRRTVSFEAESTIITDPGDVLDPITLPFDIRKRTRVIGFEDPTRTIGTEDRIDPVYTEFSVEKDMRIIDFEDECDLVLDDVEIEPLELIFDAMEAVRELRWR